MSNRLSNYLVCEASEEISVQIVVYISMINKGFNQYPSYTQKICMGKENQYG